MRCSFYFRYCHFYHSSLPTNFCYFVTTVHITTIKRVVSSVKVNPNFIARYTKVKCGIVNKKNM